MSNIKKNERKNWNWGDSSAGNGSSYDQSLIPGTRKVEGENRVNSKSCPWVSTLMHTPFHIKWGALAGTHCTAQVNR